MKIALVGQAPNENGDPELPLTGRAGRKLAELMGVSWRTYLMRTIRTNLIVEFPGKKGKGDAFPLDAAREAARAWRVPGDAACVVLVGLKVAAAFGHGKVPPCRMFLAEFPCERPRHQHRLVPCVTVPHTSGINTWYNDPKNVAAAREALECAHALVVAST